MRLANTRTNLFFGNSGEFAGLADYGGGGGGVGGGLQGFHCTDKY